MPRFKIKDGSIIVVPDIPEAIKAFKKKYPDAVEVKEAKKEEKPKTGSSAGTTQGSKPKTSVDLFPEEEEDRKKWIASNPDSTVDDATYDRLVKLYEKAKKADPTGTKQTKEAEEFQREYHKVLPQTAHKILSEHPKKTRKALDKNLKWWDLEGNVDSYFGPRTKRYFEELKKKKPEAKKEEPAKTPAPTVNIKPGTKIPETTKTTYTKRYTVPPPPPTNAPWWMQDIVKTTGAALDLARINRYMPWQATPETYLPEATFYDPTRELAANAEQANIQTQGLAAFTGPQALSARSSAIQGQAAKNAADIMARYNNLNVGIANQLSQERSNIMNQAAMNKANMDTQLWDKYTIANQQFDNAKNMARQNLRQSYIDAITNRAKTQALNTLYPNYYTDPSTGGFVQFRGDPNKIRANRPDLTNDYLDALELTGDKNLALEYLKIQKGMGGRDNYGYDTSANYLRNQRYQGSGAAYGSQQDEEG